MSEAFDEILKGLDDLDHQGGAGAAGPDIFVEFDAEDMSALVTVAPEDESVSVTAMAVLEAIKGRGATKGILHERIEDLVANKRFFQKVLAAKGEPPQPGADGKAGFKVELKEIDPKEFAPDPKKKGRADKGTLVRAGQVLVEISPPTPGKDGWNVRGKAVPARPGGEAKVELGENVKRSEDGMRIAALKTGRAAAWKGKVYVAESEGDSWKIEANVSDDKMRAELSITPGAVDKPDLSGAALMEFLIAQGVKSGIDPDFAEKIPSKFDKPITIQVAKGTPPRNGTDGSLDLLYLKGKEDLRSLFQMDEKGRVDFREMIRLDLVKSGRELAKKVPPNPGEDGTNVLGEKIPHKPGKDVNLTAGQNVALSEDGLTAVSTSEGKVRLTAGTLEVVNVFEVDGDVDFSVGNIKFDGCVAISGNVLHGFSINATKDIDVKGNVERATLVAGGSILVGGGVYGDEKSRLWAKGDVVLRSGEGAQIETDGNLIVRQFLRNCTVQARDSVTVEDAKKGHILGGRTTVGREIRVAVLGSESYTQTRVEIGVIPKLREMLKQLEEENHSHQKQIEKIEPNIRTLKLKKDKGELTGEKLELFQKLVKAMLGFRRSMDENFRKIEFLKKQLEFDRHGHVAVGLKLYPGVTVHSRNARMPVEKEMGACTIAEQEEQIRIE